MKQTVTAVLLVLLLSACTVIPTKATPDNYTRAIVQDAIRFYRQNGRQALIDHYSDSDNVDGQWYVFVIDENKLGLAHHNPERIGQSASGATDSTGYNYGQEFVSTTEEGHWISYLYPDPETGDEVRKYTWCILYDGLTFCSGWYDISTRNFAPEK